MPLPARRTARSLHAGAVRRTVLLARGVLAERIHRGQLVGLGAAALAVSLLALP
ncbi:hypothetical protein [Nonomuraea sp. NPDC052265]|uniref:hypothetical protein n=1 Tax=Nonomuraea sp. NPDC052265 TaxID=3364374 RepID=UPI0037CBB75E